MESLPSDLLLKIAGHTPHAPSTLNRIRILNKRMHSLIPVIRQTGFVARHLLTKVHNAHQKEMVQAVIDECAKKIQAQRELESANSSKSLIDLALGSTKLEQHVLSEVQRQLYPQIPKALRVMSRMRREEDVPKRVAKSTSNSTSNSTTKTTPPKLTKPLFFKKTPKET